MTPAFQYAQVRGARLAYTSTGVGSPVLWAHGMTSAAYTQERAGQFDWRPVSGRHRLLRYDARGHGRSTGGADPVNDPVRRVAQIQTTDLGPDAAAKRLGLSAVLRVEDGVVEVLPATVLFLSTSDVNMLAMPAPSAAPEGCDAVSLPFAIVKLSIVSVPVPRKPSSR